MPGSSSSTSLCAPSTYEALCGGYNLDAYKSAGACTDTFLCTTATLAEGSFGDCLNAMDCSMDLGMKTELHSNDIAGLSCTGRGRRAGPPLRAS